MNSTAHTRSAPSSRVAELADDNCRIGVRIERPNIEDRGAESGVKSAFRRQTLPLVRDQAQVEIQHRQGDSCMRYS